MREPGAPPQVGERRSSTSPAEVVIAKVANGTLSLEAPRIAPKPIGQTMLSAQDPLAPRAVGDGPPTLVTGRAPAPGQVPPPRPRPVETQLAEPVAGNLAPVQLGWSPAAPRPRPSRAPMIAAMLGIGFAVLVGGALALALFTGKVTHTTTVTVNGEPVATVATPAATAPEATDAPPIVPAPALPTASAAPPASKTRTTSTATPPVPTPTPVAPPPVAEPNVCKQYRDLSARSNTSPALLKVLAAKCKAAGGSIDPGY